MDEMDDVDLAFQQSLIPEGSVPEGFVAVLSFVGPDGESHWRVYDQLEGSISRTIGLLEMAKLELISRTDTGLPIRYPEED